MRTIPITPQQLLSSSRTRLNKNFEHVSQVHSKACILVYEQNQIDGMEPLHNRQEADFNSLAREGRERAEGLVVNDYGEQRYQLGNEMECPISSRLW